MIIKRVDLGDGVTAAFDGESVWLKQVDGLIALASEADRAAVRMTPGVLMNFSNFLADAYAKLVKEAAERLDKEEASGHGTEKPKHDDRGAHR